MTRTALYRHFAADGKLLYVGISLNSIKRTAQHAHGARWFERIARITIEWLDSRQAAVDAEKTAILSERPAFNIARPSLKAVRHVSAPKPVRLAWAVRHKRTGRLNGWHFYEDDANRLLGWFRAVFQTEQFELLSVDNTKCWPTSPWCFDTMDIMAWTTATPDWAAGDRFEKAAA